MKIPVSMLPAGGKTAGSVLFVIGVLAALAFAMKANKQTQQPKQ